MPESYNRQWDTTLRSDLTETIMLISNMVVAGKIKNVESADLWTQNLGPECIPTSISTQCEMCEQETRFHLVPVPCLTTWLAQETVLHLVPVP
jgi:hypothetical protein